MDTATTTQTTTDEAPPSVRLGCTIREAATGLVGIASQLMEELNGNIRWVVQGRVKEDGSLPEAYFMDYNMADYLDEGVADRVVPAAPAIHRLGDKVRDKVSGFEGILTTKNIYMNGCIYFTAIARVAKDGMHKEDRSALNLPQDRWEKIGVAPQVAEIAEQRSSKPPGGPILRANRPSIPSR